MSWGPVAGSTNANEAWYFLIYKYVYTGRLPNGGSVYIDKAKLYCSKGAAPTPAQITANSVGYSFGYAKIGRAHV